MKKTQFSEEQMVKILREADKAPVADVGQRLAMQGGAITDRAAEWLFAGSGRRQSRTSDTR